MQEHTKTSLSNLPRSAVAVFVDSDNVSPDVLMSSWTSICSLGDVVLSRAYGDWKAPILQPMLDVSKRLGIVTIQQDRYTAGKNATDMAMTIDVVESRYSVAFDVAVLVSGDSDFTPLAEWLKSQKIYVVVVASSKVSKALRRSSDLHLNTDLMEPPTQKSVSRHVATAVGATQSVKVCPSLNVTAPPVDALHRALLARSVQVSENDELLYRGSVLGTVLREIEPSFDLKLYGVKKLRDWVLMHPQYFYCSDKGADWFGVRNDCANTKSLMDVFTEVLRQVRDEVTSRPAGNGHVSLSVAKKMIAKLMPSAAFSSDDALLLELLGKSASNVALLPLDYGRMELWFFPGNPPTAAQTSSRQVLLRAILHAIKKSKQYALFSLEKMASFVYEVDPTFTYAKYGAADITTLIQMHPDLLTIITNEGVACVTPSQRKSGGLFVQLQQNVSRFVATRTKSPLWIPYENTGALLSDSLGLTPPLDGLVQSPLALLRLFPSSFAYEKAGEFGQGFHVIAGKQ